jgi:hypothetical protein
LALQLIILVQAVEVEEIKGASTVVVAVMVEVNVTAVFPVVVGDKTAQLVALVS